MFDVEMQHDLLIRIVVRQHRSLMASSGEVVRFGVHSISRVQDLPVNRKIKSTDDISRVCQHHHHHPSPLNVDV